MDEVDAIVCGAGAVGLAVARALARSGREVLLLERERQFGTGTSSRNSEVIHAGIYYAPGSLKAALCVLGRDQLYHFCEEHHVPHRRIGKLIVARDARELSKLSEIAYRAAQAGVSLVEMDAGKVSELEPALSCEAALFSPLTGIIDTHVYMQTLLGSAEAAGATLACDVDIAAVERRRGLWQVWLAGARSPVVAAPIFVNAAGLGAQRLAVLIDSLNPSHIPTLHMARGHYFAYSGRVPFNHLIYPVPVLGGLGTHLTLDLAGGARFGPDIEWINDIDYRVDTARHAQFAAAATALWPGLDTTRLRPDFAGIRPKLCGPGEADADFVVQGPEVHGLEGLVSLFGIESPGLTASLALADLVCARLEIVQGRA
ncbi:NAD(P)/FAD-dependent oxidoreductase [Sphingomonas sp. BIUV-7]|uniref:NAD(P)/FAD-dependent oxidoreductase n=1 Tax=Sphingomonas natans TaxID=3063330 RepID=A0ABT8YDZ3_9SPHN|nr:NAD(P)/FAD-dependent oxidoreductase [Sphingomonas sp. BIUV-7]MDO6416172.1 NAD(P)/FAD-dependent oxidoreductase [Sphingomonas sp. BIUV-7]